MFAFATAFLVNREPSLSSERATTAVDRLARATDLRA
jgi:hypothetical protein